MKARTILLAAWALAAAACVSTGEYDAAVPDAAQARAKLETDRGESAKGALAASEKESE